MHGMLPKAYHRRALVLPVVLLHIGLAPRFAHRPLRCAPGGVAGADDGRMPPTRAFAATLVFALAGAIPASTLALMVAPVSASTSASTAASTAMSAPGAVAASLSDPLDDSLWSWPVDAARSVLRPFTAPPTRYAAGHRGIDIAGEVVLAPADGVVHFAGVVVDRPVLSLDHTSGVLSSYEPVITHLRTGDTVHRGEVIGVVLPGHCAKTCLHLGVRIDGQYVSPLTFLGGIPRSVLLPTRVPLP